MSLLPTGSNAGSWTGPRPFVGRDAVLAELLRETDAAASEGGRAVFFLGDAGSGKSACLGVFEELAHRRHPELQTAYAECASDEFTESAWSQLDEHITHTARMRRTAASLLPDWLQVVPVLGPLAAAAWITAGRLRGAPARHRSIASAAAPSVLDNVRSLVDHGRDHRCLVILDQLERAAPDDLAGAAALIQRLRDMQILLVLAARTMNGRPEAAVGRLLLEAERQGRTRRVELPGFDRDDLLEVISLVVRGMIPEPWLDWLAAATAGRPGPLWDRLGQLEQTGQLRKQGKTWVLQGDPPPTAATVPQSDDEAPDFLAGGGSRLLGLAALEGETFHSVVVAELAGVPELEVEDRLAQLVRAGVLRYLGEHATGSELMSRYAFRTTSDARACAATLPEPEQSDLRARVREIRQRHGIASGSG